jgi:hypothetical protein
MTNKTNKETIAIVRQMINDGHISKEIAAIYVPELKESEGEMIRKDIIETIKEEIKEFPHSAIAAKAISWLEWLYSLTPWGYEDYEIHQSILDEAVDKDLALTEKQKSWLRALTPKTKQKLCPRDEQIITDSINYIREYRNTDLCTDATDMENAVDCEEWLSSLIQK